MAIGIDELDDDWTINDPEPDPNDGNGGIEPPAEPEPDNNGGNGDDGNGDNGGQEGGQEGGNGEEITNAIYAYLKTKGIEDPSKIKFEDDDTGDIEEYSWEDLPEEDKLNILNTSNIDPDRSLDDDEIEHINAIRSSGMSISDYEEAIRQQAIADFQQKMGGEQTPQYEIDSIPDDELYLLDLQQKLGDNVTDEELLAALENEKQNPDFFAKKINGLRQEYKALEDQQRNAIAEEEQRNQQIRAQQFQSTILNEIQSVNNIGGIDVELDVDDMNDVANLILSSDPAGVNYLQKALSNPKTLVEVACFLTQRDRLGKDIQDYMAQQIKEVSRTSYKKGLEDGKSGKSTPSAKPRVVKTTQTNNQKTIEPKSIDDLD